MIYKTSNISAKKNINRIVLPIVILVFTLVSGIMAYYTIWYSEGGSLIDAVYMTFITVTTVGYQEIFPLDTTGRFITIAVSVVGIGSLFYLLSAVMENLVSDETMMYRRNKKLKKKIEYLENHIIVVGIGRVGAMVVDQLKETKKEFVVISKEFEPGFDEEGVFGLEGDATDDSILKLAGVEKAEGMIISTANPAITTFVLLSAKEIKPDLYVVARTDDEKNTSKLLKAGADRIVNPYKTGGRRLANMIVNRNVLDVIETNFGSNAPKMSVETIDVPPNCKLVGQSLVELDLRKSTGATILAIMHDDELITNPDSSYVIQADDKLSLFGRTSELKQVESMISEKKYNK